MKYALLIFIFCGHAMAATSTWQLVEKVEGPAQWTCSEGIVVNDEEPLFTALKVNASGEVIGSVSSFQDVNQGSYCSDRSSTGGIRCDSITRTTKQGVVTIEHRICSRDLPPYKCNPADSKPSDQFKIDQKQGVLQFTKTTGWEGEPYFSCRYKLVN